MIKTKKDLSYVKRNYWRYSARKDVHKNLGSFSENTCVLGSLFNKVAELWACCVNIAVFRLLQSIFIPAKQIYILILIFFFHVSDISSHAVVFQLCTIKIFQNRIDMDYYTNV